MLESSNSQTGMYVESECDYGIMEMRETGIMLLLVAGKLEQWDPGSGMENAHLRRRE